MISLENGIQPPKPNATLIIEYHHKKSMGLSECGYKNLFTTSESGGRKLHNVFKKIKK